MQTALIMYKMEAFRRNSCFQFTIPLKIGGLWVYKGLSCLRNILLLIKAATQQIRDQTTIFHHREIPDMVYDPSLNVKIITVPVGRSLL